MDLKDDKNSLKFHEHTHSPSRYFKSHAGHLFVNNVNPFNTVGGYAGDVKKNLPNKRKHEEFIDNTPNKKPIASPSTELVNEILKYNPFNENVDMNEQYDEMHEAFMTGTHRPYSPPMVSISANHFNTESCSRNVPKKSRYDHKFRFVEYDQDNNKHRAFSTNEMVIDPKIDGNGRCEKTTYCRPLLNMYNQEFIYKTMQRNVRLQKLVRKLVLEREREKRREAWNNYINDLKNKHRYYSNEPSRISPQYVPGDHTTLEMIDDIYNTKFNWHQSEPCQHMPEDIYGAPYHHHISSNAYGRYPHNYDSILTPDEGSCIYNNNYCFYPTSSQASMQTWNRDRQGNNYANERRNRPSGRYFHGNTVVVEKEHKGFLDRIQGTARQYSGPQIPYKTKSRISSIPIQTENTLPLVEEERKTNDEDNKEIFVLKPEPTQDNKDIHFSYSKAPGRDKGTSQPFIQKTLKHDQHAKVPYEQEFLNNYKDTNFVTTNDKVVSTSHELKITESKKDFTTPLKQELLKRYKDVNVSQKLDTFKNRMSDKISNIQKSTKKENIDDDQKFESFKEKIERVSNNITNLKDRIRKSEEDTKLKTLANIEYKIEGLMKSINSIMIDIKTKKTQLLSRKSAAVSCTFITTSQNNLNRHRSDSYCLMRDEEYLCNMLQTSSRSLTISEVAPSQMRRHKESRISKIDRILLEEMKKSDKVKKDIEELLNLRNHRNCSVQLTFDIPTKERSTEVTDSLSKAKPQSRNKAFVKQIPSQSLLNQRHTQMTIAVNTDPLGLLALLRVSTETVKQLFSYVPNLNYYSYLSMLQSPTRSCVSHYICNICGAAFGRPSQLSDHIQQHNLGRTRDCCVCRHSLDMQQHSHVGLFACRYCGQRFTRAYCCELHQQTCARHLGRLHDVNSGHMLLR